MFSSERIKRQTIALTQKNFLIFSRSPFGNIFRALLFPILLTLLLCFIDRLWGSSSTDGNGGIATDARRIRDIRQVMDTVGYRQLAIVRNGITDPELDTIINATLSDLDPYRYFIIDDVDDLFDRCQQTLKGYSPCFASIIFTSFNATNVDYIISSGTMDSQAKSDYKTHTSFISSQLMPIQWALDSHIGKFSTLSRPLEQPWSRRMGVADPDAGKASSVDSMSRDSEDILYKVIYFFGAPVFTLVLIGVVYHLSLFVATERDVGMTELLAAQTCSTTPRLFSIIVSFIGLYLPGWLICSILMTQFLFQHTSDALFLLLNLLAGISFTIYALFVSSFFQRAQMAGLYTSVLTIVLAFFPTAFAFSDDTSVIALAALSALFPPFAYALMIADVARAEERLTAFSLLQRDLPVAGQGSEAVHPQLAGYSYILFFLFQMAANTAATYAVEIYFWGVKWNVKSMDSSSEMAVRVTGLTKRFKARRRWYWPCSRVKGGCLAVDSLNLEMKKGSVNFLLGPNGGGKTTTLKSIAGILSLDEPSRLEVNDDITSRGVCPQHNVFWENLTVKEHVTIWRKIKVAGVDSSYEVNDIITECDIMEEANSAAQNLSGGMQRKLQLAIAFVGGSQLCFIDEVSSGLDPLSRRNIWNIISKGTSRRTILMTTHFLDEADVLADNIYIVYKGRLVCAGSSTELKMTHGGKFNIHEIKLEQIGEPVAPLWSANTSAEATKKVRQLEKASDSSYSVAFPTLDDVFLKVTDSLINEPITPASDTITRQDTENRELLDSGNSEELEVGTMINFSRQIMVLIKKRYLLLRHNWISLAIAIGIPIVVAGALVGEVGKYEKFSTCKANLAVMKSASAAEISGFSFSTSYSEPTYEILAPLASPGLDLDGMGDSTVSAVVGPAASFQGATQDGIYTAQVQDLFSTFSLGDFKSTAAKALATRSTAESISDMITILKGDGGQPAFGIFAPAAGDITILHHMSSNLGVAAMSIVTNRLANSSATTGTARKIGTTYREMRHVEIDGNPMGILLLVFIVVAFVCSTSISIMYPVFERVNNVRALQYSNSVSPAALWIAYTIFDMQIGLFISIITWAILFTGSNADKWFDPGYVLVALILFCLSTYLGTYVISLYLRKSAFAIGVGTHLLLLIIYLVGYIVIQSGNHPFDEQYQYIMLHTFFGIASPAAGLLRALFIAKNSFDISCGLTGYEEEAPFGFNLYGGVFFNFIFQIAFLITVLYAVEYGIFAWVSRIFKWRKAAPVRLHYTVGADDSASPENIELAAIRAKGFGGKAGSIPVLVVEKLTKYFGNLFAVDEVSFDICRDETLALLGANGAGKSTTMNMIRGLIKPNYGSIKINGVDAVEHPQLARINLGVCPQDDAIDELTVRQTLDFFAAIKGLKNVKLNVDNILRALNISEFDNVLVTKLSGGTRRKLMVAIALLGNPKVLLLDEPSTGQDAGAKRVLWRVLQSFGKDRAILLTTHSMEEVQELASRVAIIGTKMLASGTLPDLRRRYGGCYRLRATYVSAAQENKIRALLIHTFGDSMRNLKMGYREANFELPHVTRNLGSIMKKMEALMELKSRGKKGQLSGERTGGAEGVASRDSSRILLRDYTITEPTMDEVFMNVLDERK